jgi:hypothetical protein
LWIVGAPFLILVFDGMVASNSTSTYGNRAPPVQPARRDLA